MSVERRRGLVRLGILLGSIAALVVLGLKVISGSSGGAGGTGAGSPDRPAGPARLTASTSRARLPLPLHGEAVASTPDGLLVIGGADSGDVSTDRVYRLDPATGRVSAAGSLVQPLHDAAATTIAANRTLVFGGGASSTLDGVQALTPGGTAQTVGQLPSPLSDLSAVHVAGGAYVLGGFDGQSPSASVLETTSGGAFNRVARLPSPVRYAAASTTGDKIYAFGGELADGTDTAEIQEYDIGTERAVVAGHLPAPVAHASAVSVGGTIYLLGGRVNGRPSDQILRFDPARNVAVRAGRLPRAVFDGAAGTFGGRAYLVGGLGASDTALDSVVELRASRP